ncbi:MAG TPA: MerR family transcriptional regulator [Lachnospiraceae bacterium]|nr:MerR family transcriptional regulator [Lachnospiraceae bacterium]
MYKIGLFSKMNKVTIKALRYYDEVGLLKPAHIDQENGYRYYTSEQLPIMHQILSMKQMGFSVEEMLRVQSGERIENVLLTKKADTMKEISDSMRKLSQIEYALAHKEEIQENYHVILKELPEVIVASIRKVMRNYGDLFNIVPPMGEEMERLGCECAVPEYCFNIYHDGEYKEENIDVEVCEAVTELKPDSYMLHFKVIERVESAVCVLHKGPYDRLPKAYAVLVRYMEENGLEPIDNPRESYIDGIWNKESEEDWLTEVQFPVRKKQG